MITLLVRYTRGFELIACTVLLAATLLSKTVSAQTDCWQGCLLGELASNNEAIEFGNLRFDEFSIDNTTSASVFGVLVRPHLGIGLQFDLENGSFVNGFSDFEFRFRVTTLDGSLIDSATLAVHVPSLGDTSVDGITVIEQLLGSTLRVDADEGSSPQQSTAGLSASSATVITSGTVARANAPWPTVALIAETFARPPQALVEVGTPALDRAQFLALPDGQVPIPVPAVAGNDQVSTVVEISQSGERIIHVTVPRINEDGEVEYFDHAIPLTTDVIPRTSAAGNDILVTFSNVNASNEIAVVLTEFEPNVLGVVDSIVRLIDLDTGNFVDVATREEPLQSPQGTFEIFEFLGLALTDVGTGILTGELESNSPAQTFGTFLVDLSNAFVDGTAPVTEAFTPGRELQTDRGAFPLPQLNFGSLGNAATGSLLLGTAEIFFPGEQALILVEPGENPRIIGLSDDEVDTGELIRNPGSGVANAAGDVASTMFLSAAGMDPNNPLTPRRSAVVVTDALTGERNLVLGQGDPVPGRPDLAVSFLGQMAFTDDLGLLTFTTRDEQGQPGPAQTLPFRFADGAAEFGSAIALAGTSFIRPDGSVFEIGPSFLDIGPQSIGEDSFAATVRGTDFTTALLIGSLPAVGPPNQAPTITSVPITVTVEGEPYTYDVTIVDPDPGDTFTLILDIAPEGMTIDPAVPRLVWTPDVDQVGDNEVTVHVSDDGGLFDTQTFTVTVEPANQAPTITSVPITIAVEGELYTYEVEFTDPNPGGTFTVTLDVAPPGMTVDPVVQRLLWTPDLDQLGDNEVTVRVSDDGGLFDNQAFTITVEPANQPPVIISIPPSTAVVGELYVYDVDIADRNPDGNVAFALEEAPLGMIIDIPTGLIEWQPTEFDVGEIPVTVRVIDANGLSDTQTFTITVEEVPLPRRGDIDGDGDVDRDDVLLILLARNLPAGENDPRDLDGDGNITVLDARQAVLECDRPGCATE